MVKHVERFESMRLHFIGFDFYCYAVVRKRAFLRHIGDIELTTCGDVRCRFFGKEFLVAFDPMRIKAYGVFVDPEFFEFCLGFMGDVARWEGAKEDVPFLITRQGGLREVRASNDDGGNALLVEEVAFRVKVSLVNSRFNIGIFEQFL